MSSEITDNAVKAAINSFLNARIERAGEKAFKALAKLDTAQDPLKIAELNEEIAAIKQKFSLESWIPKAEKMAGQLRFGTHISKGVHPDSRGNNVNFKPLKPLPEGVVGSQSLKSLALDANGNAAALPLASFFETVVCEETGVSIRDLIAESHPSLMAVFSQDTLTVFKAALDAEITQPSTHELNKQLLWPLHSAISSDSYINIVPLHPSALTSTFYQLINGRRYSEANKTARDSRKRKEPSEHQAYVSMMDLAYVQLGGSNTQNIGQLTSRQGGRNLLLPSLPPLFTSTETYKLSKIQKTLFTPKLSRCCRNGLQELYGVVQAFKNVIETRNSRKLALDSIIAGITTWAEHIQLTYSPGWSKDYQLDWCEKYWLDPSRGALEGESEFWEQRIASDWREVLVNRFALWLNEQLKRKFPNLANDFGETEYQEWQREIEDAIKASLRSGKEVFA